jgi:predicted permease
MNGLLQDLRFAIRQLRRRPVFMATAALTLAVGMGVNAVAFSVFNALLFKGSAARNVPGAGRIVTTPGGDEAGNGSLAEFERFSAATRGAVTTAAEARSSMAWRHDGTTETAWVLLVSSTYFSMVHTPVIAGRLYVAPVPGGPPSVAIGERFWRQKLQSRSLAGLTLRLNNVDVTVSGVIPESFQGPAGIYSPDVWLPLEELTLYGSPARLQARDARWLFMMGQLAPGVSIAEAQGRLDVAAEAMAREWPETHRNRGATFRLFSEGNSELRAIGSIAGVVMGIIGLVLLLACFNVANLLLARAVERERDMGIRAALGAEPWRIVRMVVTEGFVLASLSGALALLVAWWTQSLAGAFAIPIAEPQHIDLTPDARVVFFVTALVAIAGILPGVWPAVASARVNVMRVLGSHGANSAGGRPSPLRRWLVSAQIAGSTVFLVVAALFVQAYSSVATTELGFERDRMVVAELEPALHGYSADAAERYIETLTSRLRTLPGVVDVAVADRVPFSIGFPRRTTVWPQGGACAGDTCPKVATYAVGGTYFRTMGIPVREGREFDSRKPAAEAVVNEALARQQWPDGGGIGERLRVGPQGEPLTVIGIAANTRDHGRENRPTLYLPVRGPEYEGGLTVIARTAGPPAPLVRPFLASALLVDPDVAMQSVTTMPQRLAVQLWPFRTASGVFTICGLIALILATSGLAGVVIHAVSLRVREFGVRMSVGATPRDLAVEVLRGSVSLLVPGLAAGLVLAAIAARLTSHLFVDVNVLNPLTYVAVASLECAIVMAACLGPALRASHVDPLVALRAE